MNYKWRTSVSAGILFLLALLFLETGCGGTMSEDEIKASIELVEIDTRWEKKYYQPWPPKLILVPAISFKIKNIGEKPLAYIYCNGIFKALDEKENLGDNYVVGIRGEPVMPGEESDTITLQSFNGVEGKNLAHFQNNPAWKRVNVRVFVKSKGSQFVPLGDYEISKHINFKEPEPVGMDETKKKTTKK